MEEVKQEIQQQVVEETVSKAEYDKLLADYTKIVKTLNNL